MEWIKIIEGDNSTLPPFRERVLCLSEEGGMSVEYRRNGENFIYTHDLDEGAAIYWMPLPEPPKE